jgi:uncharacterized protein YdhG (YjbR/CyaY superfamily)
MKTGVLRRGAPLFGDDSFGSRLREFHWWVVSAQICGISLPTGVIQSGLHPTFTRLIPPSGLPYLDYDFQMKESPARPKSGSKKLANPKSATADTVDDYLAAVPEPARTTLKKVRAAIRSVVPAETVEVLSYKIPAFKYKQVLVWYAAFSDHCSLFPTAAVIEKFKDELKSFRKSKGTIHFPVDRPLPATLIKKLVQARLAELETKKRR